MWWTHTPEHDEVSDERGWDEQTVEEPVAQEQHKELVVGEAHAVVHPEIKSIQNNTTKYIIPLR